MRCLCAWMKSLGQPSRESLGAPPEWKVPVGIHWSSCIFFAAGRARRGSGAEGNPRRINQHWPTISPFVAEWKQQKPSAVHPPLFRMPTAAWIPLSPGGCMTDRLLRPWWLSHLRLPPRPRPQGSIPPLSVKRENPRRRETQQHNVVFIGWFGGE